MLAPSHQTSEILDTINSFLSPYQFLNEQKFEDLDFRLKYLNNGNGVPVTIIIFLNDLAKIIANNPIPFKALATVDRLSIVDAFVLFSNHLDQQISTTVNPGLDGIQKDTTVLHWLTTAKMFFNDYTSNMLLEENSQELSSLAQLLHYLGLAQRYDKTVNIENRIHLLQQATEIATHLHAQDYSKILDPHAYIGRVANYSLSVVNCLNELARFDEAAVIMHEQLTQAPNRFYEIQAYVSLSAIYKLKHLKMNNAVSAALSNEYANKAADLVCTPFESYY